MATNELALRFTESKYATRSEVSKELKMSLIDNIWSNILNYRSNFNKYLTIRTIDKKQFLLCLCPSISSEISNLDSRLMKLQADFLKLNIDSSNRVFLENTLLINCLKKIVKKHDLNVDDTFLKGLIRGDIKECPKQNFILSAYLRGINFIKENNSAPLNIDYFAELYSRFTGNDELTSFYRTVDENNPINKVLIDRIYTSAPASLIDSLMTGLFAFLSTSNLSLTTKALVAYYYINYIKPFDNYSDEIGILFAKAILNNNSASEIAVYIPLEELLYEDAANVERIFFEVQKTGDITYFGDYFIKFLKRCYEYLTEKLVLTDVNELRDDFYKADDTQEIVEEVPTIKEEVEKEVVITKTEQVSKPVETNKETIVINKNIGTTSEIAVSYIPPVLDEKQAYRLQEHLLELEPSMKKGEAYFYARHCTLGKRYTIQQYKKALKCAYETARTSMEHLVELGYYRKETVKNKFVYTPNKVN